jgi:PAS domain S-box-containing protein
MRVAREKRAMVLRMGKETMLRAPVPQHDRLQVLFLGRDSEEPPSFDESAVGAAVVAGELLGRALERVGGRGIEDTRAVHMRLLIEGTDDMVFLLDDVARFTYVNHWPGTVKHADTDSLLDRNIAELVPLSDREELLAALDAALEGAEREFLETTLQRGDGSAVPVRLEFSPVHNPNGAVVAIRGQAHDQREMRAIRSTSTGGERGTAPPPRDRNAPPGAEALLGDSAAMRRVLQQIEQVQGQPYPVLVYGETGTGKELVARALHADGDRHDGPFVAVNCAALPDSLLEAELFGHTRGAFTGAQAQRVGLVASADGGTLFLDEIGEMGPAMQARLLRVLETSEVRPVGGDVGEQVDVRVVAATHRNLEEMAESGRFRHDLLYRLDVVRIELPPLRARPDDIPILVEHGLFVVERETGNARGIDRAAVEALQQYRWPGNVRELLNVIRRCALQSRGDVIQFEDLPAGIKQIESPIETSPAGEPQSLREIERDAIVRALQAAGGNKQRAAQILGMPRATFYRRIKQYDLQHGVGPKTERP